MNDRMFLALGLMCGAAGLGLAGIDGITLRAFGIAAIVVGVMLINKGRTAKIDGQDPIQRTLKSRNWLVTLGLAAVSIVAFWLLFRR